MAVVGEPRSDRCQLTLAKAADGRRFVLEAISEDSVFAISRAFPLAPGEAPTRTREGLAAVTELVTKLKAGGWEFDGGHGSMRRRDGSRR
jgi:hypothetical protein